MTWRKIAQVYALVLPMLLLYAALPHVVVWAAPASAIPDNLQQVAARPYDSNANAIENTDFTAIAASSGATATQNSADILNTRGRGLTCVLDIIATNGASLRPEVDGKDNLSGTYYPILLATTPQTTTGQVRFSVYPGAVAASAQVSYPATGTIGVNDVLPRTIRVRSVAGNSSSHNVEVGCTFLGY